jgi:hypothetical protein
MLRQLTLVAHKRCLLLSKDQHQQLQPQHQHPYKICQESFVGRTCSQQRV